MTDPRIEDYAKLLVEECLDVQPGWQVMVSAGVLARPLIESIFRLLGQKGAYAVPRLGFGGGFNLEWAKEAPLELLDNPAPIEMHPFHEADAWIGVEAPENTREMSGLDQERLGRLQAGIRPHVERVFTFDLKWVGCQFPTPALAQDAGMSVNDFADFLFGACLLDWRAEKERMSHYAKAFDEGKEVRIVGAEGTDLTLSVEGREGEVDAGGANMPGGEFFYSLLEESANGTIAFSEFPAVYAGREVTGIRLRFEDGKVVDASADSNEDFLLETLDLDEGVRRLGELGIGCNPRITQHMKNTLFDEKIDGTVHLALGNGLPEVGGKNVSQVHWDIVKDLRNGGRLELDGKVVQEAGRWLI